MKSKIVISSFVIFVLVGSAVIYVLNSPSTIAPAVNKSTNSSTESQSSISTDEPQASDDSTQKISGKYINYSAEEVAATSSTKILFFHAPWCPQCVALEKDIMASTIPDGVTIFEVDYDSNQALRQKYGVTLQTTLVTINDDGSLIKKYVAYSKPTFKNVKDNLLE